MHLRIMPSLPSARRDQCRSETPNDKRATVSRAAVTVFSRLDFFNAKVADVARAAGVTERLGCDLDLTVVSRGNFTSRQNSLSSSPRPSFAPICANCAMPSPTDKPPVRSQLKSTHHSPPKRSPDLWTRWPRTGF